jgi:hypothetical protein
MADSSYLPQPTFLARFSLTSAELVVLRGALCRARARSARVAVRSRSVSQIWDMIRNVWEVDGLVDDVNSELERSCPIWPRLRVR